MGIGGVASLSILLVSFYAVSYVCGDDVRSLRSGMDFLQKYGYMDEPDPNAAALISEIEIRQSIMKMQRYLHLPQTGEIDEQTARMMQRSRCGLPDLPSGQHGHYGARYRRYQTLGVKWPGNHLTYTFDNYSPDVTRSQIRDAVRRALQTWSDVTPLTFQEIEGGVQATVDIHIRFVRSEHGDGYSFDGLGGTLAHAFFPGDGIGGDAHFDDDERFSYDSFKDTDLFTVAAHEFGHSLGLGHSDVDGSLMAPYYQGYNPNFALHYDDIRGVQSLYGSNPRPYPPVQPRPAPTRAPVRPETSAPVAPTQSPTCTGAFTAISNIRGEVFLFKDDQMWRLSSSGEPLYGYPMPARLFWDQAPSSPDAVFEKIDQTIVFVKDETYWEFDGLNLRWGFPRNVEDFTQGALFSMDAALTLPAAGKTYFFKGSLCWRYDGLDQIMEPGYPKEIREEWAGGPSSVDSAFVFNDVVHLVEGHRYWQFVLGDERTTETESSWLTVDFLGCPMDSVPTEDSGRSSATTTPLSGFPLYVLSALVALLLRRSSLSFF